MTHTTPTGAHGHIHIDHVRAMVARSYQAHLDHMDRLWAAKLGLETEPPQHGGAGAGEAIDSVWEGVTA